MKTSSVLYPSSRWATAPWAPIPLRLITGYGFMEHGYAKLMRGPDAFIQILHALAVPFPVLMGWATFKSHTLRSKSMSSDSLAG